MNRETEIIIELKSLSLRTSELICEILGLYSQVLQGQMLTRSSHSQPTKIFQPFLVLIPTAYTSYHRAKHKR